MDDDIVALAREAPLTTQRLVEALGISRATAQRRLRALVDADVLEAVGAGRGARYIIAPGTWRFARAGLREDEAWKLVEPRVRRLLPFTDAEVQTIGYVFTEMVNNAIDHSDARRVSVRASVEDGALVLEIADDGIGCFERVRSAHDLETIDDAIVQLEKGKLTSAPAQHTGEGIFFSSKAAQRFRLESNGRAWLVDNATGDSAAFPTKMAKGTRVEARFVPKATTPLPELFRAWTNPETLAFEKTRTTIQLASLGRSLLSRSEAKRIVAGLEKFAHVTLDFAGVDTVGQGFVDEIFRVFAMVHPTVSLEPVRMNEAVAFMVARGRLPRRV